MEVKEQKICPLSQKECQGVSCGWWDTIWKSCAVIALKHQTAGVGQQINASRRY